ncbi:putative clavaminate synthase-like protein [Sesbania bispinosa]|nr:putative clavaminate synthase-like protein [Sesbania bispinosa]
MRWYGLKSPRNKPPSFSAMFVYDIRLKSLYWYEVGMHGVVAYTGWEDEWNDPVKAVTFGDGHPLPSDIVYDIVCD